MRKRSSFTFNSSEELGTVHLDSTGAITYSAEEGKLQIILDAMEKRRKQERKEFLKEIIVILKRELS